jgi:hypothetical protein
MVCFSFRPIHQGRLLIELHSGKLPLAEPLTLVRPCLLRVGASLSIYFADLFCLSTRQMLQVPSNVIVAVAATRMYRLLVEFGSKL